MIRPELKAAMIAAAAEAFWKTDDDFDMSRALDAAMETAANWKPVPGFPPGDTNEFIMIAKHWKD